MENIYKIAVLIDADNAPARSTRYIFSKLAKEGKVTIRKAYGNWKSDRLNGWVDQLQENAIQPVQQFDIIKGKNATDIAMTIDAMDILYDGKIDTFCIVSSDCDFTPLVTRILASGYNVIGFGERKSPEPFVNSCSKFLFLDENKNSSDAPGKTEPAPAFSEKQLRQDTKLLNLIRNAISVTEQEDGWSKLAAVGSHISNHASFDPENYGYKRLSDLINAIGLFEIERGEGAHLIVRDIRNQS